MGQYTMLIVPNRKKNFLKHVTNDFLIPQALGCCLSHRNSTFGSTFIKRHLHKFFSCCLVSTLRCAIQVTSAFNGRFIRTRRGLDDVPLDKEPVLNYINASAVNIRRCISILMNALPVTSRLALIITFPPLHPPYFSCHHRSRSHGVRLLAAVFPHHMQCKCFVVLIDRPRKVKWLPLIKAELMSDTNGSTEVNSNRIQ